MLPRVVISLLCLTMAFYSAVSAQSIDSATDKVLKFPSKFLDRITGKTASLQGQLSQQTSKYLQKMMQQEQRLQKQLGPVDSGGAQKLFAGSQERYTALLRRLQQDTGRSGSAVSGPYQAYADSLHGTLAFLQQNPQLLSTKAGANISTGTQQQLQKAGSQLQALQSKMQDAGLIQQYMQQRQSQIQNYLSQYSKLPSGITNTFNKYKTQAYYYDAQIKAYKEMLNDPDKMFRTALTLLNKLPAFGNFMKNNSLLTGAFNMSGGSGIPANGVSSVTGMPSRDQVMQSLQSKMGAVTSGGVGAAGGEGGGMEGVSGTAGPTASGSSLNASSIVQGQLGAVQGQLDQFRQKLASGSNGGSTDIPGFQPNGQKTKTFLHRLEYGVNFQTTHNGYYFPITSDLGFSLGYKLNNQNRIGIGASYKIGWGSDISHIQVTSQGLGLRSFLDIQIKKSWFATGGYEYNYQQPQYTLHLLRDLSNWQKSGLIGFSKVITMNTKVFKSAKLQFLWDFLSYQQVPQTQPFVFRIGYTF
jgi:hypothetical protein